MYRYWSGTQWTPYLNVNPTAPPPYQNAPGQGVPYPGASYSGGIPAKKKSPVGWIIALGAIVVAVAVVVWFVVQPDAVVPAPPSPGPEPTGEVTYCPQPPKEEPKAPNIVGNRIYGGKMSYQLLGDPWSAPKLEERLAFADWTYIQYVIDQANIAQNTHWSATVLIAEVYSGDGFGGVKVGAEMILECVKAAFYGDTVIDQEDLDSRAYLVDGNPGWLIETKLHFSISGVNASYDQVLFLLVETGNNEYSLYYASIPNTSAHLLPDARAAMESLRVDK
jgi:hypothetical protein